MPPYEIIIKALKAGLFGRCPRCGEGRALHRYVKVIPECAACGEKLDHYRSDDLPAYLTILLGGHIIVPLVIMYERAFNPGDIALPVYALLALIVILLMLPRVKGLVLAWMWCLYKDQRQADC